MSSTPGKTISNVQVTANNTEQMALKVVDKSPELVQTAEAFPNRVRGMQSVPIGASASVPSNE